MPKYFWRVGTLYGMLVYFFGEQKTILENFKKQLPDLITPFENIKNDFYTEKEKKSIKEVYYQCRNISIDYGIMETAENVYVLPSNFGWSDLGTWKSLYELSDKDENQNVIHGDVMTHETNNTIIKATPEKLVIVQGLENFIVAEKDNVLVICHKDQEQQIKNFLAEVRDKKGNNSNYV